MHQLTRHLAALIIGVASLFVQSVALAYQLLDTGIEFLGNPGTPTILFVNGVKNDRGQAAASSEKLIKTLHSLGLPYDKYNIYFYYNPANWSVGDFREVEDQIGNSNRLLLQANGSKDAYYRLLGAEYNARAKAPENLPASLKRIVSFSAALKGEMERILELSPGLVVVPHSQGNLYVEAAYAMLVAEGRSDLTSKIRVVGVAPASATTPSDRYVLSTQDEVITINLDFLRLQLLLGAFKPLPANVTPCTESPPVCGKDIDWKSIDPERPNGHGFVTVYLNEDIKTSVASTPFPQVVFNLVKASLDELDAPSDPLIVYTQSFNTDPGWQTDQPSNLFWTPTNQTYFARTFTEAPATRPNRYGAIRLPDFDPNRGFTLTWDQRLNAVVGSATVFFGLMSDDRLVLGSTNIFLPALVPESTLAVGVGRIGPSEFTQFSIYLAGGRANGGIGNLGGSGTHAPTFDLGTWYRFSIKYEPLRGEVTFTTVNRDTNQAMPYYNFSRAVPAVFPPNAFSPNMRWLGVANDAIGYTAFGNALPTDYVEAEFDNVSLVYLASSAPAYNPTLAFSPRIVPAGGSATLTWDTGGAPVTACTLSRGGSQQPALTSTTGSLSVTNIQGRITYTLTCGASSVSATVEIVPVVQ